MTQPLPRFAFRHHGPAPTAALVLLFWAIAATLVTIAHRQLDSRSPLACGAVVVPLVLLTAWAYMHAVARESGAAHALGVGIAWLVLSIAGEITLTTLLGHRWFSLLGSPDQPFLRNLYLFVWIFGPAIFARRTS